MLMPGSKENMKKKLLFKFVTNLERIRETYFQQKITLFLCVVNFMANPIEKGCLFYCIRMQGKIQGPAVDCAV